MVQLQEMHHPIRRNRNKAIAGLFILILIVAVFLIYQEFSGSKDVTGQIISTDLNQEDLELNGNFKKIELYGTSKGSLKTENAKYNLENLGKVKIILSGYEGKVKFNSDQILELSGKAKNLTLDSLSIEPSFTGNILVSLEGEFSYTSLKINDLSVENTNYASG